MIKSFNICHCSDLGVHIDGYIALVAHTMVATKEKQTVISGKKADVILAAYKGL